MNPWFCSLCLGLSIAFAAVPTALGDDCPPSPATRGGEVAAGAPLQTLVTSLLAALPEEGLRGQGVGLALFPSLDAAPAAGRGRCIEALARLLVDGCEVRLLARALILDPQAATGGSTGAPARPAVERLAAASRARGLTRLITVEILAGEGHLALVATLHRVDRTLWQRVRAPLVGASAHVTVRARLDAQLRGLLGLPAGALPREWELAPLPTADSEAGASVGEPVLDLALGDIDRDGQTELLVLDSRRLRPLRLVDGKLAAAGAPFELGTLGRNPAPAREPLGRLMLADLSDDGTPEVVVRTSAQPFGVVLTGLGGPLRPYERVLVGAARRCGGQAPGVVGQHPVIVCDYPAGGHGREAFVAQATRPGTHVFLPEVVPFHPLVGERPPEPVAGAEGGYTRYWLRRPSGSGWKRIDAVRRLDGGLALYAGTPGGSPFARLDDIGDAFLLTDLNDDGLLEIVAAGNRPLDEPDRLTLHTEAAGGALVRLFQATGPACTALGGGDLDGDGRTDVVAARFEPSRGRATFARLVGR